MKRVQVGLLVVGCLVFEQGYFAAPSLKKLTSSEFFHTEGWRIVGDTAGQSVVLRCVNLTGLEFGSRFSHPYPGELGTNYFKPRPEDFQAVSDAGLNCVRLPFEWARLVPNWQIGDPSPQSLNQEYLDLLDQMAGLAAQTDLRLILDMHSFFKYWSGMGQEQCVDDPADADRNQYLALLADTWRLLAAHFGDDPAILGYDIMNEPARLDPAVMERCRSCKWDEAAQSVIEAIRDVDSNHLVFVEGKNFSLASNWPVENGAAAFLSDRNSHGSFTQPPRLVYSPHVYFDLKNGSKYDQPGELAAPLGAWQDYMRDRLVPPIRWSRENNVPVFFGETGVPCSEEWARVLDRAFTKFFDPFQLSVGIWQFIDPQHCSPQDQGCVTNLAGCDGRLQLNVLQNHPGGVAGEPGEFQLQPSLSRIYDEPSNALDPNDARVSPWDTGDGFFKKEDSIERCPPGRAHEGRCALRVVFDEADDSGVKFIHEFGIDARRFGNGKLRFWIFLEGEAQQDFKIFTTAPRSDCERQADPEGGDPVYPERFEDQPSLREFLPSTSAQVWQLIEVPLSELVPPDNPIINSIAFQNLNRVQEPFLLDDIALVPEQQRLLWAQFADGQGFFSELLLTNLDSEESEAWIEIRGGDGQLQTVPFQGQSAQHLIIPPSGLRKLQTGMGEVLQVGSATAMTSKRLAGVVLFGGEDGLAGVQSSEVLNDGFLAPMETHSGTGTNTGIAVMNLEAAAAPVKLELRDANGNRIGTPAEFTLEGMGHKAAFLTEFDWGADVDLTQFQGTLKARTPGCIAATVLQSRPGQLATMPVVPISPIVEGSSPAYELFFAQFAGGEDIFSQIFLLNRSETMVAQADVLLKDMQGNPLEIGLDGVLVPGHLSVSIPPAGLRILRTDTQGDLKIGSVRVTADKPVAGVILFGGTFGLAGVGSSQALWNGFIAPIETEGTEMGKSINTGIAMTSLSQTQTTIDLILCNADGLPIASGQTMLSEDGQRAFFVDEIDWTPEVHFDRFLGILKAMTQERIAATVIQTRADQFATLPVIPK